MLFPILKGQTRLGGLFAILAVLVVVVLDVPGRMLSQCAYAMQRARLQADSEELEQLSQNLARIEEVSHAFRLVARIARPGVAHIRAEPGEEAILRLIELEHDERRIRRELEEMTSSLGDDTDEDALEAILQKRRQLIEITQELSRLQTLAQSVSGSGIIFDRDGHILTNNHVIEYRRSVMVRLPDEREYEATIVGTDPKTDLAVIKIDAPNLHPLKFGDSERVEVGDWVIAVGAPFGLSQSVTHGIISATGRHDIITGRGIMYQNFLQTDAAINPGNSGGPLLNLRGEVIGVNTAIATDGEGYNAGIAFTIPANTAVQIGRQLIESGEVARGWLGITMGELTAAEREIFGVETGKGVLVTALIEDGPAENAGIVVEDVILAVNKTPVSNMSQLRGLIAEVYPGEKATFNLLRGDQQQQIAVKLDRRPSDEEFRLSTALLKRARKLNQIGLYARTLLPDLAPNLGYKADKRGVLVLGSIDATDEDPPIKSSELIVQCNDKNVSTVAALSQVLERMQKGKELKLTVINPEGEQRTVSMLR